MVHRDTKTQDGCPAAGTVAAAGGSKQPAAPAADAKAGDASTSKQKQQPGRKSFHTDTAARTQQQQHVEKTRLGKPAIGSMAGIGRRLLQLAADFGAVRPGGTASSSRMLRSKAGGAAGQLDAAVADSSSKSRVACWGRVYVWPFGEDGKVLGFNKAPDGLFITSSVGRCVMLCLGRQLWVPVTRVSEAPFCSMQGFAGALLWSMHHIASPLLPVLPYTP